MKYNVTDIFLSLLKRNSMIFDHISAGFHELSELYLLHLDCVIQNISGHSIIFAPIFREWKFGWLLGYDKCCVVGVIY